MTWFQKLATENSEHLKLSSRLQHWDAITECWATNEMMLGPWPEPTGLFCTDLPLCDTDTDMMLGHETLLRRCTTNSCDVSLLSKCAVQP